MMRQQSVITAVYADGGVIGRNPSPMGGTWAWCHVNAAGERITQGSGIVEPAGAGLPAITNNYTEMVALLNGLSAVPFGWHGVVYSDSQITLGRLFWGWKWTNIPADVVHHARNMRRWIDLTACTPVLLDGHPTKAQLATGVGKRGGPVSEHNVWCDKECGRQARSFMGTQR